MCSACACGRPGDADGSACAFCGRLAPPCELDALDFGLYRHAAVCRGCLGELDEEIRERAADDRVWLELAGEDLNDADPLAEVG